VRGRLVCRGRRDGLGRRGRFRTGRAMKRFVPYAATALLLSTLVATGLVTSSATGATQPPPKLVSVNTAGNAGGNDSSRRPAISSDGRFIAFQSNASDLVPGDTNGLGDVFVRDRISGVTERANVSSTGAQAEASGFSAAGDGATISADGRFVGFD